MSNYKSFHMSFDGQLLKRGFWIYIWRITKHNAEWLYVGRTGDSSSPNASSPFNRIGQHLDFRPKAKGNALARQLKTAEIDPSQCKFEMVAVGPIFKEQADFDSHKPIRDKTSALEKEVAIILRERNYKIIGTHQSKHTVDDKQIKQIMEVIDVHFPYKKAK